MDAKRLFEDNLPLINHLVAVSCRRQRMTRQETEDFGSVLCGKLWANDYAVLRAHEGRSSLKTYLAVVVSRALLDYRNKQLGKWRPSAEARRHGPLGIRVDMLIHRDGHTVEEACALCNPEDRDEVRRIAALLPPNFGRPKVDSEPLEDLADRRDSPEDEFARREREDLRGRLEAALKDALDQLSADDRALIRWRIEEGLKFTAIARILGVDVKHLYHRWEGLRSELRVAMESRGCDAVQVRWVLEGHVETGKAEMGPSVELVRKR